jgi:uncharacterized RDD family membrane protein YckC
MSETPHEDPVLFDLPLAPAPPGEGEPAPVRRTRRPPVERAESLPLFGEEDGETPALATRRGSETSSPGERLLLSAERPRPVPVPPPGEGPGDAPLAPRLRAAAGDLVVLAAVATLASGGASWMGAPIAAEQMPALGVFLLAWSFLYFVISLAFWGQTPGMAWAGLIARSGSAEPLSFGQTARRWIATWLTWALAGLPGLLALTGRSLVDRLSRSRTLELEASPSR